MLSPKDPPREHGPDTEQQDPEKGGAGDDQEEHEYEDEVDLHDFGEFHDGADVGEGAHNERPRQGVPLTPTTTFSSSIHFSRPSLPNWLCKVKDVFFVSHEDHHDEIPNYRRIPIFSGSLIPFSILLEIPGLTESWYVRTFDHVTVESRKNPPLIVVSMSISIALAVVANIALIYRFLDRHVKMNTIICIVALTIHDILNIVTVATFAVQHSVSDGFTNSEAFWMTICSTVVSTLTNLTLIWDFVTTPNFAKAGSGITPKQRSLIIITMIFLTYIALGALISSLMMKLTFVNGLFFTIVTTLTIGFGDIVPETPAQRFVVCLYAVFGIIILSAGIRLTSEAVLEGLQLGYRRRLQNYKRSRRAKKREREQVRRWRAAVEERLVEHGHDVWTSDNPASPSQHTVRPATLRRGSAFTPQAMYLNTDALPQDVLESAAQEAGVPLDKFIGKKFGRRSRQTRVTHNHNDPGGEQTQAPPTPQQQQSKEGERGRVPMDHTWTIDDGRAQDQQTGAWGSLWFDRARQALHLANTSSNSTPASQADSIEGMSYHEMIKTLEKEERLSLYTKLGLAWALFFIFWTVGSVIFSKTEGWTYGSAMYFCFIAFTTIGYGDLAPQSAIGRSIFVFWALFGVGAMTVLFAVVSDAFSTKYRSVTHDKRFDRAVRRYRQGQEKAVLNDKKNKGGEFPNQESRSRVVPALKANLARISSREPAQSVQTGIAPRKRAATLAEAEDRLRSRTEPLPALMLKEVLRLRDHTRYFLMTNGHADIFDHPMDALGEGGSAIAMQKESAVHSDLKQLLDEIAEEEGLEEHLKQEVWDDAHARKTLFLLSLEKGARKMTEAAELALETLVERNELLAMGGRAVEFEEPEEMREEDR